MQITLLRHGKTEFDLSGNARACDLSEIAKFYDLSGIVGEPPDQTMGLVNCHKIVICSDLPRSVQSAEALGATEVYSTESVFRETSIPHFNKGVLKLPVSVWILMLRCLWVLGYSKNGESFSMAKERAKIATQRLIQLAKQFESVLLVGHGLTNYFIAKELLSHKWSGPSHPGKNYWSYGVYRYHAT